MSSPNNTVVSKPGQFITDAFGNTWSIVNRQVAVNGVADQSTNNVIQLAFENGVIWQKNTANLWWGKSSPSAAWGPPAGTSVDPIPNQTASANGSIVTVAGGAATGSITDASGNTWSIASGKVTLNGVADASTQNVVEVAYAGGRIWQENASHLWWSKSVPADAWGPGAGTSVSPVRNLTRTWGGGSGSFATANHWSPNGVPQSGDTAVIGSGGDVNVGPGAAAGVNFLLQGGEVDFLSAGAFSIGTLKGSGVMQLGYPTQTATVATTGISLSGGSLTVREFTGTGSTLVVQGNSSLSGGASLTAQLVGTASLPRGPLENDGTMTVNASTLSVGMLSGHGKVVASGNSTLSMIGAASSETVELQSAHLTIGGGPIPTSTALQFLAPITGFGATSAITLSNTQATSGLFKTSAPTAGELFLYNGSQEVADLHISGQAKLYAAFSPSGSSGSVTITAYDPGHGLPITTT